MKTIKIKSTMTGETLAHPGSPIGKLVGRPVIIYAVTDVPSDIDAAEVLRLFDSTCTIRHQFAPGWNTPEHRPSESDYTYRYAELGLGLIVR